MNRFVGLKYSPWTERALWALDHHDVPYEFQWYQPVLGDPLMRLRRKRLTGKVTVPVLFAGDQILDESMDIVRYAEDHGEGSSLELDSDTTKRFIDLAEACLRRRRSDVMVKMANSDASLRESMPAMMRAFGPVGVAIARTALASVQRKYDPVAGDPAAPDRFLEAVRTRLSDDHPFMADAFSYADIAVCAALQTVSPVADEYIRLGEAGRQCWVDEARADEYSDVFEWRDALYASHRR